MISIWYSHDEAHHEFSSVSEVGNWIGDASNPSIIAAEGPGNTLKIVIGDPTRREATVTEFAGERVIKHGTADRATGIRTFLARLGELYE